MFKARGHGAGLWMMWTSAERINCMTSTVSQSWGPLIQEDFKKQVGVLVFLLPSLSFPPLLLFLHNYCFLFLLKYKDIYIYIYVYILVYLALLDLSCGMWRLGCNMWNLVPWPGIEPRPLTLGAESQPVDRWGSPQSESNVQCLLMSSPNVGTMF